MKGIWVILAILGCLIALPSSARDLGKMQLERSTAQKEYPIQLERRDRATAVRDKWIQMIKLQSEKMGKSLANMPDDAREQYISMVTKGSQQNLDKAEADLENEQSILDGIEQRIAAIDAETAQAISEGAVAIWSFKTPNPNPRFGATVAAANNKIYVIGGTDGTKATDRVDEYDPATDTWKSKASWPNPRSSIVSAVLRGKIYVIGGKKSAEVDVYDPSSDTWSNRKPLPVLKTGNDSTRVKASGAIGAYQGKLFMIAGWVQIYYPGKDEWKLGAHLLQAIGAYPTAMGIIGDKIYVLRGGCLHCKMEVYDPATDVFTFPKNDQILIRKGVTSCVYDNKIYLIGGSTVSGADKPGTGGFGAEVITDFNKVRSKELFVYEIFFDNSKPSRTVELFDPISESFISKSPMLTTSIVSECVEANGKLYMGLAGKTLLEYDPSADN